MSNDAPKRSAAYELLVLGLSLYVLVVLAIESLVSLDPATRAILSYADTAICFVFLFDFFTNLIKAKSKLAYLRWGWIDLVSSIPTVDVLRAGRAVRVVRVIRVLRGFRSVKRLSSYLLEKRAQAAMSVAVLLSILFVIVSAVAILQFEARAENANIKTAEDALWWAYVTITTVGYGDRFPVTIEGRFVAAALMTVGVGMFGTFTGFVASWFLAAPKQTDLIEDSTAASDSEPLEYAGQMEEHARLG
jgi:voltage-gated potassium channel